MRCARYPGLADGLHIARRRRWSRWRWRHRRRRWSRGRWRHRRHGRHRRDRRRRRQRALCQPLFFHAFRRRWRQRWQRRWRRHGRQRRRHRRRGAVAAILRAMNNVQMFAWRWRCGWRGSARTGVQHGGKGKQMNGFHDGTPGGKSPVSPPNVEKSWITGRAGTRVHTRRRSAPHRAAPQRVCGAGS
jgi:hypothetical protein